MNTFTVNDFTRLCQFINCRPFEDFAKMYLTLGLIGVSYAEEKYKIATRNFISWWCNLGEDTQMQILNYVKDFYDR